jgi:O-antigen/teichoic acid export membrane protein
MRRRRPPPRTVRGTGPALLFAALTLANVGNFGFHALASHQLEAASYGVLGSVLVLVAAITVPLTAYQAVLTAQVRRSHDEGYRTPVVPALRRLVAVGVAAALLLVAVTPALAAFLHLDSVRPLLLAAGYLIPLTAGAVGWAVATGTGRYHLAAGAVLAMVATRFLTGATLIPPFGVDGAVAASVVAESVLALVLLLPRSPEPRVARRLQIGWANGGYSAATSIGLCLLIGADVLLARHLFPGVPAGHYAAAATLAHIAMYLPQSAATVMLPSFAVSDGGAALAALRRALGYAAVLGATGAAALTVLAESVAPVLFGASFTLPLPLVVLLSAASAAQGALYVVVQFLLARGSRRALAPWFGVVVLVGTALWLQPRPVPLASLLLVCSLLALVLALNGVALETLPARPGLDQSRPHDIDLTVVIPYFNPGPLLRPQVARLVEALEEAGVSFEAVAVSDGSTDGSPETIADLDARVVHRLILPGNAGKGEALCAGLRVARGRYIGFIDADGDLDPRLWRPLLELLRLYRPDAIIGSKRHPLSEIGAPPLRRVCSWGFQTLSRLLFRLPVRDTQVGLKVFRREVLADALPLTRERRFTFDLELLVIAHRLGYRRIMEAPVTLVHRGPSTVRPRTVLQMFAETVRLAWRLQTLSAQHSPSAPHPPGQSPSSVDVRVERAMV